MEQAAYSRDVTGHGSGSPAASNQVVSHVNISGSGQTHFGNQYTVEHDDVLRRLPYASSAPFNSSRRQHDPLCLEGTRVDVLEGIYSWVDGGEGPPLYWLNGMAGTGKSTIARTVARRYYDKGYITANFFFSRGSGDAEGTMSFITTLAVQLASRDPDFRRRLEQEIRSTPRVDQFSLQDQWQQLILAPLSALQSDGRVRMALLVVDALDECNQNQDVRALLGAMTTIPAKTAQHIRIFVTSRPELTMRHHFAKVKENGQRTLILHRVEASTVEADIKRFLSTEFAVIRDERGFASEWPGTSAIQRLTRYAAGLFIYAATTCRFVRQGRQFAKQRLDLVLSGSLTTVTEPEQQLDKIYMAVLANAISDDFSAEEKQAAYAQLRHILGSLLVLKEDLPLRALSAILGYSTEDLQGVLEQLHAVLDVTDDLEHIVRPHHPSFRDFLENSARCTNPSLVIVRDEAHSRLMHACMQVMRSTLKQDICNLGWTTKGTCMRSERKNRAAGCYIPIEVQYACEHWTSHLCHDWETLTEQCEVESFLHKHCLHWIEVVIWLEGRGEFFLHNALSVITEVTELLIWCQGAPSLAIFAADAMGFVSRLAKYEIRASPLQVYLSAALFEPSSSAIHKQFETTCLPPWICRWPCGNHALTHPDQFLMHTSSHCTVFTFSPDGRAIACALSNFVRLFDLDSSEQRDLEYSTNDEEISELLFSPDADQVAVMHRCGVIRIWNVGRIQLQCSLGGSEGSCDPNGYARLSLQFAFSDARRLVSYTTDGVICIWNTETGQLLSTTTSGMGPVMTGVFSEDGKLLFLVSRFSPGLSRRAGVWRASAPSRFFVLESRSSDAVGKVQFCPNSTYMAFQTCDKTVEIRRVGDFSLAIAFAFREEEILALDFVPDSSLLGVLTSSRSRNGPEALVLRIFRVSDGSLLSEHQLRCIIEPDSVCPFNLHLVLGGRNLWAIISANNSLIMLKVFGSAEHISHLCILDCGQQVVSKDRKKVATLTRHKEHVMELWKVEDLCDFHTAMSGMLESFLESLPTATGVAYLLAEGRSFAIRDPGNMVGSYFQIRSAVGQWNHWLEVVHDEEPKKLVEIPNNRQVFIYFPALKST